MSNLEDHDDEQAKITEEWENTHRRRRRKGARTMRELIIDGVIYEMSETRFRQLSEDDAIIEEDGEWIVNHGFSNFSYEQVMWFMTLDEE